ncbi:MAG: hypothetical protein MJY56_03960 [Bacteroidales bacterium]|nr:hypothetical protein [Bacteroidales bacterium]
MNKSFFSVLLAFAACLFISVSCQDVFDDIDVDEYFESQVAINTAPSLFGSEVTFSSEGFHRIIFDESGRICKYSEFIADGRDDKSQWYNGKVFIIWPTEDIIGEKKGNTLSFINRSFKVTAYPVSFQGGEEDITFLGKPVPATARIYGTLNLVDDAAQRYDGDMKVLVKLEDESIISLRYSSISYTNREFAPNK